MASSSQDFFKRKSIPCSGTLHHRLMCGHQVMTLLIDDCSSNCVEPGGKATPKPFHCPNCLRARVKEVAVAFSTQQQQVATDDPEWWQKFNQLEQSFQEESARMRHAEDIGTRRAYESIVANYSKTGNTDLDLDLSGLKVDDSDAELSDALAMLGRNNFS